jgi:hypothetical protein
MNLTLPAAALATRPAATTSARYGFVDTRAVIDRLASEGWRPAGAQVATPRARDRSWAKHLVDFRHPDLEPVRGAVPRILFTNSHDGTSSARLLAGVFRFVCSNGLVIGDTVGRATVRHTGDAAADLLHRVQQLAKQTEAVYDRIERWSKKDLTRPQRVEFARFAAQLRWGDAQRFAPEELLQVRRAEDDRGDLWTTFNRLQENTVRGGLEGLSRSGRAATSRPLSDITRSVAYNQDLWSLAEEIAATW